MTFKAFASLRHASRLSLVSGWASCRAMVRCGTPERVASSPEELNEDKAKGWTLKNTFTPSQINLVCVGWDTKGSRIAPVRCGRVSYVRVGDSKLYVHKVLINTRWMYCDTSQGRPFGPELWCR